MIYLALFKLHQNGAKSGAICTISCTMCALNGDKTEFFEGVVSSHMRGCGSGFLRGLEGRT